MINESNTAILERHVTLTGVHCTEPYECAWAREAIFFVYPVEPIGDEIRLRVEVSADGRRWIDHDVADTLTAGSTGARIPVTHFGGWLRLRVSVPDGSAIRCDIYLVLKE